MKSFIKEFFLRGFMVAAGGPIVLAVIYFILGRTGTAESLSPNDVSLGILSITVMAFIASGITAIYKNEKLPIAFSALIHAAVLYLDYLIMYLLNDWIPRGGIWIFTGIFAAGFGLIWLIIYLCIRKKTENLNNLRRTNF